MQCGKISVPDEGGILFTIPYSLFCQASQLLRSPDFLIANKIWQLIIDPNEHNTVTSGWTSIMLNTFDGGHNLLRVVFSVKGAGDKQVRYRDDGINPTCYKVDKLFRYTQLRRMLFGKNLEIYCKIWDENGIVVPLILDERGESRVKAAGTERTETAMQTDNTDGTGIERATQTGDTDSTVMERATQTNNTDETIEERSTQMKAQRNVNKLLLDFQELLQTGKDSDLTLKVKDKEFKAHRLILSTRSSVFSAMFQHNMLENATGVVTIADCDPESFTHLLHYLYTGKVESVSSENAMDLYTAADKYQLNDLKSDCLNFMLKNITIENFCFILALSLRHDEKELTDVSTRFFLRNAESIILTTNWQTFMAENPTTGNELFLKYVRATKH